MNTDEVRDQLIGRLNRWKREFGRAPSSIHLPEPYAQALLDDLLDRLPEDERDEIAERGLDAVYGGRLFGIEIRRVRGSQAGPYFER